MKDTRWCAPGDLNAFFGLLTDNLTQLVLLVILLGGFGFPADVVVTHLIPGTALGVLVGDLAYTWMGARLSRRLGRPVTAMPLGIDTPSLFGFCFIVLGPAFQGYARGMLPGATDLLKALEADPAVAHAAAMKAWKLGMALMILTGIFKLAVAPFGGTIRRAFPRAALLGPLAGVAVCLIAFLPMLEILEHPVAGLTALAIVLVTLVAGWRAPFGIPGACLAVAAGTALFYLGPESIPKSTGMHSTLPWPTLGFLEEMKAALGYLPIALPFALATVVGGIDCAESAAAAGDDYDTASVLAVEGAATLAAGLCGGVIQTTPYIGHPAYKRMGGRSGYTLATGLFIGLGGALGLLGYAKDLLPAVALVPILAFIGLEITAQAFRASEERHAPAVALAFLPCVAYLLPILASGFNPGMHEGAVRLLGSGFIVSSFLWAAGLAWAIDRKVLASAGAFLLCGALALFGVVHSPHPGAAVFLPWDPVLGVPAHPGVGWIALGYAAMGATVAGLGLLKNDARA